MRMKVLSVILWFTLVLSITTHRAEAAEPPVVSTGQDSCLFWVIKAPPEAHIDEEFSIMFEFSPSENLDLVEMNATIWTISAYNVDWFYTWMSTKWYFATTYSRTAYLTIETEASVSANFHGLYVDSAGGSHRISLYMGNITRIRPKSYDELLGEQYSLNQSYLSLQDKYSMLQNNFNTSQTLMYAFIVTTIIFIVTTSYSIIRKRKG